MSHFPTDESRKANGIKTWQLVWSPEGRIIATVLARTRRAAVRKAPSPYRRYLGEIYALSCDLHTPNVANTQENAQ